MVDRYDPDELLVCPYDPVHRIARKRLQGHLIKCRKNYNTRDFATCPFNAKHVVPKPELSYHINSCEDRSRVELEIYHSSSIYKAKGDTSVPDNNWDPPPSEEESWDDDNVKYVPKITTLLLDPETPPTVSTHKPTPRPPVNPPPVVRAPSTGNPLSQVYQYSVSGTSSGRGRGSTPSNGITAGRGRGMFGLNSPPKINGNEPRGLRNVQNALTPTSQPLNGHHVTNEVDHTPSHVTNEVDHSVTDIDDVNDEDQLLKKKIRKLTKMCRQIELIEQKQGNREVLQVEQVAKLQRKQEVYECLRRAEEQLKGQ